MGERRSPWKGSQPRLTLVFAAGLHVCPANHYQIFKVGSEKKPANWGRFFYFPQKLLILSLF
jgi:hypothetical protein